MSNFTQEFFSNSATNSILDGIQKHPLLWKAVISQAITDAVSNCKKTESIVEKHRAIFWLSNFSQDFMCTCIFADYDPVYIQNKVQLILAKKPEALVI